MLRCILLFKYEILSLKNIYERKVNKKYGIINLEISDDFSVNKDSKIKYKKYQILK
jgi:hypothetical protein